MFKIFGAPSRYVQGPGALDTLGEHIRMFGHSATLVIDSYVHGQYGERIAAICAEQQVQLDVLMVQGDLTPESIAALCEKAAHNGSEVIVAAGGGKSLDAGKGVAKSTGRPLITVPTVASNDAPTSKNYVLYDENHRLLAVEHMRLNPAAVVVDTSIIAAAPRHFFLAGIGDAISKKYEAEQCFASDGRNMYDGNSTLTAQAIAQACLATLLADGEAALQAAGTGQPTPAFERVVEAMILMSGLGFESGGLSIAHALTRGLPHLPGVATALHGLQVAVGLLIQLDLEARNDNSLANLYAWYTRMGLPTSLRDIGALPANDEQLQTAARLTLEARHAANFQRKLDTDSMVNVLQRFM